MHLHWMHTAKLRFAVTLQLHTIVLILLILTFGSSSSFFLPSPYDVQQAIASTSVESSVIISNKINFTTPEVSLLYPANWNVVKATSDSEEMNNIITLRLLAQNDTDNSLAILNITSQDLVSDKTTEQYANEQLSSLKVTIPDFQLIQSNKTTLAGRPAYQIVYTGLEGTEETRTMKLWVIDQSSIGSTAYTITYSTKPENYLTHLASARDMIKSFAILEKVTSAPPARLSEALEYVPEPSRQEVSNITEVGNLAVLPSLKSILGDDQAIFTSFINGSTNILPSNLVRLPTDLNGNIAINYHLSSAYLNPRNNIIYEVLALIFTHSTTNRVLQEPIDYQVRINGSNFDFQENGNTSTGFDIKVLNGTALEKALERSEQYELGVEILNINRIGFKEGSAVPLDTSNIT